MNWLNPISKNIFGLLICSSLFLSACALIESEDDTSQNKEVLAQVDEKKLYTETLAEMDISADSKEDSMRFVEIYVTRWIRDELLIQEAKEKMEDNPRIKELVEEYRNSLLLHEYEEQLIKERLDSSVSKEEMRSLYEEKKESYILNQNIYKAKWIFTNSSNINIDSVRVIWNRDDSTKNEALTTLSELYAKSFNLNRDLWWTKEELSNILQISDEEWDQIKEEETLLFERAEGKVILRVLKEKEKGAYAPLTYVDDNIRRFILHQRKEQILKDIRNDLYRSAVENNKIKINIKK